jgi:hypothetical protein
LRRARFGRSSEKLDREIEQLELLIGDLECQSALNIDPRSASNCDPLSVVLVPVVHRGDPRVAECPMRG